MMVLVVLVVPEDTVMIEVTDVVASAELVAMLLVAIVPVAMTMMVNHCGGDVGGVARGNGVQGCLKPIRRTRGYNIFG